MHAPLFTGGLKLKRWFAFVVGFLLSLAVAWIVSSGGSGPKERPEVAGPVPADQADQAPEPPIQLRGPFPLGERISLEEAERQTPYRLPILPTDEGNGELIGVWIDHIKPAPAIGFVWETDLRMYVYWSDQTEAEAIADFERKVAAEPQNWTLTTARGRIALGANLKGDFEPTSSLTFVENGLDILVVSPQHTLDQLRQFTAEFVYEGEAEATPEGS